MLKKIRFNLSIKILLFLSLNSFIGMHSAFSQCDLPTYQGIYDVMRAAHFREMSDFIKSSGGVLEEHKDTLCSSQSKYLYEKKDSYKFCVNDDPCRIYVKQECSDWSLCFQIDIYTNSNAVFNKYLNAVKNTHYNYSYYDTYYIFGDANKMFEPMFEVSFSKYTDGDGGNLSLFYLVGQ